MLQNSHDGIKNAAFQKGNTAFFIGYNPAFFKTLNQGDADLHRRHR